MANWKTKDSASNDSKHSLTSVCSHFLPEYNFDLLRLFPNHTPLHDIKAYRQGYGHAVNANEIVGT